MALTMPTSPFSCCRDMWLFSLPPVVALVSLLLLLRVLLLLLLVLPVHVDSCCLTNVFLWLASISVGREGAKVA